MKKFITLLFGALLASSAALAQTSTFEELDTDADGVLSKAEFGLIESMDFTEVDTDQDGSVSQEEFSVTGLDDADE